MSLSDPLGDMITRIRNSTAARHKVVKIPLSKLHTNVLEVLKNEGYIESYSTQNIRPGIGIIEVRLKYIDGEPVIREIKRVSKPGRRIYTGIKSLKRFHNGLGISILSTPKGVISEVAAQEANTGGEVLCQVF